MDWVIAVGQNLASDAIFVALLIGVGRLIHILTNRRRLLRFFGIQQTKRITIYRSRIGVAEGGAVGVDGHRRSYAGFTTPIGEAQAAAQLMRLFQHPLPSFGEDPPGRLRNLLVADVETVVTDSQESADQLEAISSFISLGSPAYNTASGYAEQVLHSQARFELGRAPPKHDDPVAALEGISQTVATPSTFQLDTDTGDGRTAQARIGTDTSSRTLRKQSVLPSGIPFLRATSLPDDMSPAHPEHVHTQPSSWTI